MSVEEIQSMKDSLQRIETALVGDPKMGNAGIVTRLESVEREAQATKAWREKLNVRIGMIASVMSFVATAAIEVGTSLFNRK